MPSWFTKAFKEDAPEANPAPEPTVSKGDEAYVSSLNDAPDDRPEAPKPRAPRRIVDPGVFYDEAGEDAAAEGDIRIKAQVGEDYMSCVFMVDRPVLKGYSAWFPFADMAHGRSPLAERIFEVEGIESVLIHGMTVTVQRDPMIREDWEETAKAIGARIRGHLQSGEAVMHEAFFANMPSESEIVEDLQRVIDTEINPGIAAHSGAIALDRVEGNTVYIQMMGGCQGCAASTITLKQGIHQAFRQSIPEIGAILDETDHTAGTNPFFKELPPGMSANA